MATFAQRNHARSSPKKAEEYPASAVANLATARPTVAAGDAIHAGICAKDAIVTELTGTTTTSSLRRNSGRRWDSDRTPPARRKGYGS